MRPATAPSRLLQFVGMCIKYNEALRLASFITAAREFMVWAVYRLFWKCSCMGNAPREGNEIDLCWTGAVIQMCW